MSLEPRTPSRRKFLKGAVVLGGVGARGRRGCGPLAVDRHE